MPSIVPVKHWMTGDPVAVEAGAPALEALDLMHERGIRHLPVIDGERRVVGVLSIDDLRAALPFPVSPRARPSGAERASARGWRVSDVMTHAPLTATADTPLAEAAQRMAEAHIGCLPVVDDAGQLTGVLSETDMLHALTTTLWADGVRDRRAEAGELDRLVAALRRERAAITGRLDGYHAVERELSADLHDRPADPADRGADEREIHVTEKLDELAARRLDAIDRALDHAAQGRLGVCDACGGKIPAARLRALPGTTLCVGCAREAEAAEEPEVPFERVPGGRAETGRPELGDRVDTRFGEGQLLRVVPFGTCPRCGDVEGWHDEERDGVVCINAACRQELEDVVERAIVQVGEREVYVDPATLAAVDPAPFD
jgi:CBS domain-containing protein/RNA polymerase-binding transcription factor DksA